MKKIYSLVIKAMNGTVTMMTNTCSFTSKELAEKTEQAVYEANKNNDWPIITTDIKETELYETENEVPILNENTQKAES